MQNARKKPRWVLLDQFHVDINVSSDMSEKDRKAVIKDLKDIERIIKALIIERPSKWWDKIKVAINR